MADTLMYVDNSNGPTLVCHRRNSSFTQTKGLLNRPGQNNCFLNSAVQVLWHLDIFRSSFRDTVHHKCVGDMCIFCALKELFTQFQYSGDAALPPDALRKALAQTFHNQQKFQLGYMDDAAECFENILLRIHFHITNGQAEDLCHDIKCIPHQKFAMTLVEQGICRSCGATSEPLPFTQMVHYISSSTLCAQERFQGNDSCVERFGQLLRRASEMGDVKECPSGCGAKIQIQKCLMNHPEIISIGIAWDSERPTLDHIMDVFSTIGTAIQLQDVFHSVVDWKWASNVRHQLVGVVTYYGKHYSTFFFHTKLRMWIYFDDATVRQIGPYWEHVVDKCRRGHFQPLLLLYANLDAVPASNYTGRPSCVPPRHCVSPAANQHLHKLHVNGYDLDSDTGYSSSDRSPIGAKHPYETSYDYYKAHGHSEMGQATHFNFQLNEVDGGGSYFHHHHPKGQKINSISNEHNKFGNVYSGFNDDGNGYISRKAVESVLNYQKVHHNVVGVPVQPNNNHFLANSGLPMPPNSENDHYNAAKYYNQNANKSFQNSSTVNGGPCAMPKTNRGPYDAGYDSFSLSSNDSYPVNHRQLHYCHQKSGTEPFSNIPEMHTNVPLSNDVSSDICQSLCWEADSYLKQSVDHENVGDFETAINLCNGAAAKARAAMDAPYSNPHSLVLAQRKHNTCIMRARSLHRRILARQDSINSYSSSTGTETDTVLESGSTRAAGPYHSRQSSRDSSYRRSLGNHSRQSSKDRSNGPSPAGQVLCGHSRQSSQDSTADKRRIEVYATLPKSAAKKSVIKNILPSLKSDAATKQLSEQQICRDDVSIGYLSSCESQPPLPKKTISLCRTNSIPPKLYNCGSSSNAVPQKPTRIDDEKMAAKVEKNKQHRVRRKCLMGGLLRRKNNSMPDLREDQQNNGAATNLPFEEVMSPAKSEQNLTENRNSGGRVPPPPPVRTTSQLSIRSQSHGNLLHQQQQQQNAPNSPSSGTRAHNHWGKAPLPTPPAQNDEFDLPPPPPSLLIPPLSITRNLVTETGAPPKGPMAATESALPHWLKELQNKQQQIGQKKQPPNPVPEKVAVVKPSAAPLQQSQFVNFLPPNEQMNPNEYKVRSVRDLASKFEQKLHLVPPVSIKSPVFPSPPSPAVNDYNLQKNLSFQDNECNSRSSFYGRSQGKSPTSVVMNHQDTDQVDCIYPKPYQRNSADATEAYKIAYSRSQVKSPTNFLPQQQQQSTYYKDVRGVDQVDASTVMKTGATDLDTARNCYNRPQGMSPTAFPQSYNKDVRNTEFLHSFPVKVESARTINDSHLVVNHHTVRTEMESPNGLKQKSKGPKKSVKFSDQIILVAGADESENLSEILQSPLFKKVLQKSLSGKSLEVPPPHPAAINQDYHNLPPHKVVQPPQTPVIGNRLPCSLCHKKIVLASSVYCTDCEFYMSRFKPKK